MQPHWTDNKRKLVFYALLALFVTLVVALLFRLQYVGQAGEFADEAYQLTTAYRYIQGDIPFVSSWDTNFSSALLATPFVMLYQKITSGLSGILLAYRSYAFVMRLVVAFSIWGAFKRVLSRETRLVLMCFSVVFIPSLMPAPRYGCDLLWFALSVFVLFYCVDQTNKRIPVKQPWWILLGGVSSMVVLGNPLAVLLLPVQAVLIWRFLKGTSQFKRALAGYVIGVACIIGAAVTVLGIMTLGNEGILSGLVKTFFADDHSYGFSFYLQRIGEIKTALVGGVLLFLISYAASCFIVKKTSRWRMTLLGLVGSIPALLVALILFILGRISLYEYLPELTLFLLVCGFAGAALSTRGISNHGSRNTLVLFVVPWCAVSIGYALGSNSMLITAFAALFPVFVGEVAYLVGAAGEQGGRENGYVPALVIITLVFTGFLLLAAGNLTIWSLSSVIEEGPAKGLRVSPAVEERYSSILRELKPLPQADSVVIFGGFQVGYLLEGAKPATYSTWATSTDWRRLDEYLKKTGQSPQRLIYVLSEPGDPDFSPILPKHRKNEYKLVLENPDLLVFDKVP